MSSYLLDTTLATIRPMIINLSLGVPLTSIQIMHRPKRDSIELRKEEMLCKLPSFPL
jgi:hypothetical protein